LLAEYWAHEAALMAVGDWPLLRWRMGQYRHGRWGSLIGRANTELVEDIRAAEAELGPSTAGQIEAHLAAEPRRKKGTWWTRSDTKSGTEALSASGALNTSPPGALAALFAPGVRPTASRVGSARHYDLVERVLPPSVLAREVDDEEAIR